MAIWATSPSARRRNDRSNPELGCQRAPRPRRSGGSVTRGIGWVPWPVTAGAYRWDATRTGRGSVPGSTEGAAMSTLRSTATSDPQSYQQSFRVPVEPTRPRVRAGRVRPPPVDRTPGRSPSRGCWWMKRDRPELHPALVEELRSSRSGCTPGGRRRRGRPSPASGPVSVCTRATAASPGPFLGLGGHPAERRPPHRNGRFPIPAVQRRHLTRLHRAHVDMDDLVVAHEIPRPWRRAVLPPMCPSAPLPVELDRDDLPPHTHPPRPGPSTTSSSPPGPATSPAPWAWPGRWGQGQRPRRRAPLPRPRVALGHGWTRPVVFGIQRIPLGHPHAG